MKVAFLVPTTSRGRRWHDIRHTYLNRILLHSLQSQSPDTVAFYIGFDTDDPLYAKLEARLALEAFHPQFTFRWHGFAPDRGNVTAIWNGLAQLASADGFEYFMVCGDDITFPVGSLAHFWRHLQANRNVGWASGRSGNDRIATQFLVHQTHLTLFGWVFPPQIRNWYCDDFLHHVYPPPYRSWHRQYELDNGGGVERYQPRHQDRALCYRLIRQHRPAIEALVRRHATSSRSPDFGTVM